MIDSNDGIQWHRVTVPPQERLGYQAERDALLALAADVIAGTGDAGKLQGKAETWGWSWSEYDDDAPDGLGFDVWGEAVGFDEHPDEITPVEFARNIREAIERAEGGQDSQPV